MSDRKILVPIDFSAQSRAALGYAEAFAKDYDAELLIVHVMHPDTVRLEGVDPVAAVEGLDATLHQVKPADASIRCAYRLLEGVPAEAILEHGPSRAGGDDRDGHARPFGTDAAGDGKCRGGSRPQGELSRAHPAAAAPRRGTGHRHLNRCPARRTHAI